MGIDGSLALAPDPAPGDGPDPVSPGPERHDEVRRSLTDWLRANLTPEVVAAGQAGMVSTETVEILRAWNRMLADAGWAAI